MFKLTRGNFEAIIDGLIRDVNIGDLGNAVTSYIYFDMARELLDMFSVQHKITATTLTYEGTNDDPSVPDDLAIWSDITLMLTDGTDANFTADGSLTVSKPIPWGRLRIKQVTTNANNALELRMTRLKA